MPRVNPFGSTGFGIRQRLRQEEEIAGAQPISKSYMARHLLEQFAFGLRPAVQVRLDCGLAVQDHQGHPGSSPEELLQVAAMGSGGARNPHAEMVSYIKLRQKMPMPYCPPDTKINFFLGLDFCELV